MKPLTQVMLVAGVLVVSAIATVAMLKNPVKAEPRPSTKTLPLVRVMQATPTNVQLVVHSQGNVQPRTEITLSPEISGVVAEVSPSLVPGGFFEAGDVLVRIESKDYELAATQAVAQVIAANARLVRELAEAEVAKAEWQELGEGRTASALTLREPQLAEARAALASAEATVEQARRELQKTTLKAPFAGRVSTEAIDVGQFVNRGTPLALLQSVETAEVRLPIPPDEASYADLPIPWREGMGGGRPQVLLSGKLGNSTHTWTGTVVRTESEVDRKTRMIIAVAEVKNPYQRAAQEDRPPLLAGLFVTAEIVGHTLKNVFEVPRDALRGADQLLLVDDTDRLRFRTVEVLRAERGRAVIRSGLHAGERICLSPLETPVDGMQVRIAQSPSLEGASR
jgi:RND family efflux transporter MFP subunit